MATRYSVFLAGKTVEGNRVEVRGHPPYGNFTVYVNGEPVEVTGRASLYRDGGTVIIPTERGDLVRPSRLKPERVPSLDGVPFTDDAADLGR